MAVVVGALRVTLGADIGSLEDGLKKAGSALNNFAKRAGEVAAGIKLEKTITKITDAMGDWVANTLKTGEQLNKLSQQTGVTVEELSKLKFAAEQSDVPVESLAKAFGVLSRQMVEASVNAKSQVARALAAMGIELKDSEKGLKTNSQLFAEIADKFASYEDGAEKAALAQAIFKRTGIDIIPLLNQGAAGIEKLTKRLEELGGVWSGATAKAADDFKDTLSEIGVVINSIMMKALEAALPEMQKLATALADFAADSKTAEIGGRAIAAVFNTITEAIAKAVIAIGAFPALWQSFVTLMQTPIFKDDNPFKGFSEGFTKARADFTATAGAAKLAVTQLNASLGDANVTMGTTENAADGVSVALGETGKKLDETAAKAKPPTVALKEMKNALEQFLASQQKSIAGQNAELSAMGMAAGAKERLKVQYQALQIAAENNIPVTDALRAKIDAIAGSAGGAASRIEGMRLKLENLDPLTKMNLELANTSAAMASIGITSGPILERALDNVREKFGSTWTAMGKNVADFMGSMQTLTAVFGKQNKTMFLASQAFGIAQAVINTQVAVTKALATLPPPASFIAAAAAAAAGAAAVATIVAQKFATGGSFVVPGAGGIDSTFVPIMATPGERVTVETPEQQRRGSGEGQTIVLQGNSFHVTEVRDLFEIINSGLRDGHRFKVIGAPA